MKKHADVPSPNHNLPRQISSFIGREDEIESVSLTLNKEHCQLLTLVGMGGIGKTRLALEVAGNQFDQYPDGVFFVNLQPVDQTAYLIQAVIDVLGYSDFHYDNIQEFLFDILLDKHMLLILDNFEHLLEATQLISEMLQHAPHVNLLVTSRQTLNLREEWVHHVEGLEIPKQFFLENMESYSAIQLFAERARQVQRKFDMAAEQDYVVQICKLVGGMPLGIELATAWLKTLSCHEILNSIQGNLKFLSSPLRNVAERHRSIHAVFEHSWRLLTDVEQRCFMKLSVFCGSFSVEASLQVARATVPILSSLVDKSLLRVTHGGRYDIHELLRQFALEHLERVGEVVQTKDNHSQYYLNFLQEHEDDIKGRRQLNALDEIDLEMENIRIAWYWGVECSHIEWLDSAMICLFYFCQIRNYWNECRRLFDYARSKFSSFLPSDSPSVWGRILSYHSAMSGIFASMEEVKEAEEALKITRQYGTLRDQADSALHLTDSQINEPISHGVFEDVKQSLSYYQSVGDKFMTARVFKVIAMRYGRHGQFDRSIEYWRKTQELAREIGDKSNLAHALQHIGIHTLTVTGDYHRAASHWEESYQLRQELKQRGGIAASYGVLSWNALLQSDLEQARILNQQTLDLVSQVKSTWDDVIQWSQRRFGHLAIIDGDYPRAKQLFHENHQKPAPAGKGLSKYDSELGLALSYYGLGEFGLAKRFLFEALQSISNNHAPGFYTQSLPLAALVLSNEGDKERAVRLLALAFTYPLTHANMFKSWAPIETLQSQLKAEMGEEAYHQLWNEGTQLDLKEVAFGLIVFLQTVITSQEGTSIKQPLYEPLTKRELEVLQWLMDGLTNRDIAVKLSITEGTVKKHNNNIFGKLHVENRTQAIARARTLKLLP